MAANLATLPMNAILTFFKPESTLILKNASLVVIGYCLSSNTVSQASLPCTRNNFVVAVFHDHFSLKDFN